MKVELLVSAGCPSCAQAEAVWRRVADEYELEWTMLDVAQPPGAQLVERLALKAVPAVLIDGELKAVGVLCFEEARQLASVAPLKAHAIMRRMGMFFSGDNRWFVVSAQIYLMLAGLGLVLNGSFLADSASRPAFLHLFTLGFMLFMIYGLGAHMLPRFTGNSLSEGSRWSWLQMGLAHGGVLGYAIGYFAGWPTLALAGAVTAWLSLLVFTVRMWPILWPEIRN